MTKNLKSSGRTLFCMATLWVLAIATGASLMLTHEFDAGSSLPAPSRLPDTLSDFTATSSRVNLFMTVHPECPCTSASIEQLDRLLARNPDRLQAVVLFRPEHGKSDPSSLARNDYWRRVSAMPGARAELDLDGALARQLHADVSGWAVAYDALGVLRFQGGLTPSRGHAGSSRALDQLDALARGLTSAPELCTAPAFGCALEEEASDV